MRDVVFAEDACRVRQPQPAHLLAALRNTVLSLARHLGFPGLTEARRLFALNFTEACAAVGTPLA